MLFGVTAVVLMLFPIWWMALTFGICLSGGILATVFVARAYFLDIFKGKARISPSMGFTLVSYFIVGAGMTTWGIVQFLD
jgi:hypothetical protein